MNEVKHTPGEWQKYGFRVYVGDLDGGIDRTVGDFNFTRIRERDTGMTPEEAVEAAANSNLFLAAPDMLAALKAVAAWDAKDYGGEIWKTEDFTNSHIGEMVRAAIAKAEGGAL